MKIGIVIPAYNEEKRIAKTLQAYSKYFENARKKGEFDYELLIVINGTTDSTPKIVSSFVRKNKRIKSLNLKRGGKGFAVRAGFTNFLKRKFDLIGFVDADLATSPEAYNELISNISNYDGIIASRYIPGAKVSPKPTLARMFVSRVFNILIRVVLFLPYQDTQCGAKLFKREALGPIMPNLSMSNWAFDVDILFNLQRQGFKIREYPTTWSDQKYSKINFMQAGPFMALSIIRLGLINSPFRFVMRWYDSLPSWLKIYNKLR
ncbi:MAG: glycosyltransferase [archaeon]